ncbi:ATP-dependent RNA helicase [Coemansia guatemalensis]|uniref:ATP-dependent RNA helicase n=1 Tax=Coemansia guatemalensis TaxID=2761395 RepID=A0A9W8I4U9_9FUNG|nr:ATP-dependent RNA helicase [Coemansia guatemalensis]
MKHPRSRVGGTKAASQQTQRSNKRRKPEQKASKDASNSWESITMNPPPLPTAQALSQPKATRPGKPLKMRRSHASIAVKPTSEAASASDSDNAEGWDWRDVAVPTHIAAADNEIGGVVSLQEIDGVNCTWEEDETTGGRVLKLSKVKSAKELKKRNRPGRVPPPSHADLADSDDEAEDISEAINWNDFVLVDDFSDEKAERGELQSIGSLMQEAGAVEHNGGSLSHFPDEQDLEDTKSEHDSLPKVADGDIEDPDVDVSAWQRLGVHADLLRALKHLGFAVPTEIQSKSLPASLSGSDLIGAAETGSGKTLAFGIPMLQYLSARQTAWTGPTGLVLAPTRELAIQVKNHLKAMARFCRAHVIAIVGGMSQPKQERLLNSCPDIIIATPGRFWELVSSNDTLLTQLQNIKFLAVDEADRMLEPGHFKELKLILKAVNEQPLQEQKNKRQTFVFSATLLKDMQLVSRKVSQKAQRRNSGKPEPGSMKDLIERIGFQDKQPALIDVTSSVATARTLVESRIDCLVSEKDYYLYYFLTRYPARTLVFANSIDTIRRILPILRLLGINVFGLHAQMEQRQRLKNVDRFRETENAVLVASDVAARGLDIPQVEYVIHYQIPRSGDLYVHRSGRTARASNEGLAIMLVSPEERKLYHKMCAKLDKDISAFPIDLDLVGRLKPRVDLAREVDLREHKLNKQAHERNWFKKNANELDIDLDSDFIPSSGDEEGAELDRSVKQERERIKVLKSKLNHLLSQKIHGRGVSGRYLSGSIISDLAERLIDTTNTNKAIPTLFKESALVAARLRHNKKRS